jgi:hypothetical protein
MIKANKLFGILIPADIKWCAYNDFDTYYLVIYGADGVIDIIESTTERGLYCKVRRELKDKKEIAENINIDQYDKSDYRLEIETLNHIIDSGLILKQIGFFELSPRFQAVLSYRFGFGKNDVPHSLEETGQKFG